MDFTGLLSFEFAAERARDMDEAGAFFPAPPPLFKFAGEGVLGMPAFAFLTVSAVQFQSHSPDQILDQDRTRLHAGRRYFI